MPAHRPLLPLRDVAVALAASTLALTASAATQVHTSAATFAAAAGTLKTETFGTAAADVTPAAGAAYAASDFVVHGAWILDAPTTRRAIDSSTNLFIDVSLGGWADLRFDQPIRAFGAWFANAPVTIKVDADSLAGFGSYQHLADLAPANEALQFIGFTSDQPFNRLVFEGAGCCSRAFAIDNVAYAATLAPVPEPGGWALLAGGLAALARLRRRAGTTSRS